MSKFSPLAKPRTIQNIVPTIIVIAKPKTNLKPHNIKKYSAKNKTIAESTPIARNILQIKPKNPALFPKHKYYI